MLLLAPLISLMPQVPLAAEVIVYPVDLIQPAEFRSTLEFRPLLPEHADDDILPGPLMLRLTSRLFFANAEQVRDRIHPLVVALDLSGVFDLEYTAVKMLTEAELRQREQGVALWLGGLTPEVLEIVQRSPLGRERRFFNMEQALAKYQLLPAATG
jgi:MFS superfamily sulfate permease-like transporter